MQIEVANLKYPLAFQSTEKGNLHGLTVQSALTEPLEAFRSHVEQIRLLLDFPARMYRMGETWRSCLDQTMQELFGTINPDVKTGQAKSDEVQAGSLRRYEEMEKKGNSPEEQEAIFAGCIHHVDMFSHKYFNEYRGLAAQLAVVVTQTWTAYEVFATDLWVKAVDCRPRKLAMHAATTGRGETAQEDRSISKNIPIMMLQKYGFDLRTCLGTVLRDSKRFDFDSLSGLKTAYVAAFDKSISGLFDGLDHDQLAWLEAVRNVLAHRAGKADEKFLSRVKRHPKFSRLKVGDEVVIDGELVAAYFNAIIRSVVALAKFVDKWLVDNPD
jgi:hypothetical protein